MNQQHPFKWRHFASEIILLCVRWYLRYSLSYRDLEEMMLERGLQVDHTTIYRWVQHSAPELEKQCREERSLSQSHCGSQSRRNPSRFCRAQTGQIPQ
jgi:transposase-like protein